MLDMSTEALAKGKGTACQLPSVIPVWQIIFVLISKYLSKSELMIFFPKEKLFHSVL